METRKCLCKTYCEINFHSKLIIRFYSSCLVFHCDYMKHVHNWGKLECIKQNIKTKSNLGVNHLNSIYRICVHLKHLKLLSFDIESVMILCTFKTGLRISDHSDLILMWWKRRYTRSAHADWQYPKMSCFWSSVINEGYHIDIWAHGKHQQLWCIPVKFGKLLARYVEDESMFF